MRNERTDNNAKSGENRIMCGVAYALIFLDVGMQSPSLAVTGLQIMMTVWAQLPEAVRMAVAMLIRADVPDHRPCWRRSSNKERAGTSLRNSCARIAGT
jgi:hypothetical protein